ncbi:FeoA family protein [uncultured Peptoniphilus sp.]|uniref:FeoA family protein n=2 Tax=Peptoniphilaceae TaxID=1570339 RepID=UPI00258814BE|nr:FeoA family protein [uncultured Peptoniphilus sp.]
MIIEFKYCKISLNLVFYKKLEVGVKMLSLVMAPLNVDFRIVRVKSLKNSNVTESHLANLGFVRGAIVKVLNENDGNLIVSIKGARVAIGKDIAKKIMVEEM